VIDRQVDDVHTRWDVSSLDPDVELLVRPYASCGRRCELRCAAVTFVSYEDSGMRGPLGTFAQTETAVVVPGCRHRPLTMSETAEYDVDVSTAAWKTTAPPAAAVLAAKADGELRVDGQAYKIVGGPMCHVDERGRPYKVTILSQQLRG